MKKGKKTDDMEQLLKELQAAKKESAVTVDEVKGRPFGFWRAGKLFFSVWRKSFLVIALLIILLFVSLPFITFFILKQGSTYTEQNSVFLERIQELKEFATAEAYEKVILEQEDNKLFGQSIGLNLPGTKRHLLLVIQGSVKAGVNMSSLTEKDVVIDEENKTAKLTLPPATFLGEAEIDLDEVKVYSYEGLFRDKADIKEGYELAEKAKKMILEEAAGQGVLTMAQHNAEKTLREMFSFAGYDVTIEFKDKVDSE